MSVNISGRLSAIADFMFKGNKSAFGREIGMTPQALNSYIKGERLPGLEVQKKINAIGISINWLIHGKGNIFDIDSLSADAQFKRLFLLRNRSKVFHGTQRIAADMLKVDLDTYSDWEMGLKPIPPDVVDRIYSFVESHIRKEWWYNGKGEMFISKENFDMPIASVEELPHIDSHLQKDIEECITEIVTREGEHDRQVFGELLKIKLREAGVIASEDSKK